MRRPLIALVMCGAFSSGLAAAQQPNDSAEAKVTQATYLVTGLHCPPCTRTVEASLSHAKGIKSIKVDWKTKAARVEFDESIIPAQSVATLIAATPHMMGRNQHYAGWLALKIPQLKDKAQAERVEESLRSLSGVVRVAIYPEQRAVGIAFDAKGSLTSEKLIATLAASGVTAEIF